MSLRPYLLLLTLIVSISLVACGGSSDADTTPEAATSTAAETVESSTTAAPAPSSEASETTTVEESAPDTSTPATATTPPAEPPAASPISDLKEYSVLKSTIDDLDSLTPEIETDNPNTRVILFADADGRKVYKSIFVKRNNRLKIINIDGGGPPLYNDSI